MIILSLHPNTSTALVVRDTQQGKQLAMLAVPVLPPGTRAGAINLINVQEGATHVTVSEAGTYIAHEDAPAPANQPTVPAVLPVPQVQRPSLSACIINPATFWLGVCGALFKFNYYEDQQFIKEGLMYLVDQKYFPVFVKVGGIWYGYRRLRQLRSLSATLGHRGYLHVFCPQELFLWRQQLPSL